MPRFIKTGLNLLFVCALFFSLQVSATPKVVVTVEPLYEIVEGLMAGIDKPLVLLNKKQLQQTLSNDQVKQLLAADLIIRVGDGLEPQLGKSLKNELKILSNYTLTLSNYMPLLKQHRVVSSALDAGKMMVDRQKDHDMRFWMDPKLLKMATRYITPQLVRMDPDHQDQYLENELVVLEKIRMSAQQAQLTIKQMSEQEKRQLAQINPYFAHRFIYLDQVMDPLEYLAEAKMVKSGTCNVGDSSQFAKLSLDVNKISVTLHTLANAKPTCQNNQFAIYEF